MKKTADYYCQKFKMDQPRFNFDRRAFIKCFGLDFIDTLQDSKNSKGRVGYGVFKREIANAQRLFNDISVKIQKAGKKPLSKGLFNVFYVTYVIEIRKLLFKNIQDKIDHKKKIAAAQWAPLIGLSEKLNSDEYKTKNEPSKKGS